MDFIAGLLIGLGLGALASAWIVPVRQRMGIRRGRVGTTAWCGCGWTVHSDKVTPEVTATMDDLLREHREERHGS